MRKLVVFNMITLDGYMAGPEGDISWHNVDAEFNEFAIPQLDEIGLLLFGRVTYTMMASYWPTPQGIADDPEVANRMNTLPKIVFSRSLPTADWQNTRLIKANAAGEVAKLKQESGKDLFLFGSADLANSLFQNGLVDEYRLIVNPVVLGQGKPMFKTDLPIHLSLEHCRTFKNGNVLLVYQTQKES